MHFNIKKFYFNNAEILRGLNPADRKKLNSKNQARKYKKGKVIYREGHSPKGVYILHEGKVKIYQSGQDGKRQILHIYTEGEMFGYRPIISNDLHPVTAVAFEDCRCDFIPRLHFTSCLHSSFALSQALLVSLSREFTVWVNNISVFARYPVKSRIALALLVLQQTFSTAAEQGEINLTRTEFASYIGTVKEMVVRNIQLMKKSKIVETSGSKIRVLKPEVLKNMVDFY